MEIRDSSENIKWHNGLLSTSYECLKCNHKWKEDVIVRKGKYYVRTCPNCGIKDKIPVSKRILLRESIKKKKNVRDLTIEEFKQLISDNTYWGDSSAI